ncbi:MAG: serine hydrolase domain-containing protein [Nocardioidaceae bacterium]
MDALPASVRRSAEEHGFSGVVRVDRPGEAPYAEAFGLAERAIGVPNTVDTRFGIASGTKTLTAVTVLSLVADGLLALDTRARALLRDDLPEIDDRVTVEQLLAHRSGIGDYIDEDTDLDSTDYLLDLPVHRFVDTEDYLPALAGFPPKFPPGSGFSYCNSGYVVLALLAQRAAGRPFDALVEERVCRPGGLERTSFIRSDELPADAARGYLAEGGLRTNVLHLPVRGSGDGGVYTTVADVHRVWQALLSGGLVPQELVAEMRRARGRELDEGRRYGFGLWLDPDSDALMMEGMDAGVSFFSEHRPSSGRTWTVIANTGDGAWPMVRHLAGPMT